MKDNEKVCVVSTINAQVGINLPDLRVRHEWGRKGSRQYIEKKALEDIMYEPGVDYMFKTGILYIDDMEVKKELGLEPETATEPQNIIVLDEKQIKRYLTVAPFHEFKAIMDKLSKEQRIEMANYAVDNEILPSLDKSDYIKKAIGIDVMQAINLNRLNKAE